MDFILLAIVCFLFIIVIVMFIWLYNVVAVNSKFLFELSDLVSRTFREYYANEDIEPVTINNGIDLVWKGKVDGYFDEDSKRGFITIFTNDSYANSPINDYKEADVLAGKITHLVNDYIRDRDSQIK